MKTLKLQSREIREFSEFALVFEIFQNKNKNNFPAIIVAEINKKRFIVIKANQDYDYRKLFENLKEFQIKDLLGSMPNYLKQEYIYWLNKDYKNY